MLARLVFGCVSAVLLLGTGWPKGGKKLSAPISGDPSVTVIRSASAVGGAQAPSTDAIAVSSDGTRAYVPSTDARRLLDVEMPGGQVQKELNLGTELTDVELSPDGTLLAVVSSSADTVTLLETETFVVRRVISTASIPRRAKFSPDGKSLYVACQGGFCVQAFSTSTQEPLGTAVLREEVSDVAVVGDGKVLAVACPLGLALRWVDVEGMAPRPELVPVPAGTRRVAYYSDSTGAGGVLLATSSVSRALTVVDAASGVVLKTLTIDGPEGIRGGGVLEGGALVGRQGGKIQLLDRDPASATFGESGPVVFVAPGTAGFAVASVAGNVVAATAERASLVGVRPEQFLSPPKIERLDPSRAVPGTLIRAEGSFPTSSGLQVLFMIDESLRGSAAAGALTPTSFEVELPLELETGALQIWVSRSSALSVASGIYIAAGAKDFEALDGLSGLDDLIAELERAAGVPDLKPEDLEALRKAIASLREARSLLAEKGRSDKAFEAMIAALESLKRTGAAAPLGAELALGRVAQVLVYGKLRVVTQRLGEEHPELVEARKDFERGRSSLKAGDVAGAMDAFRESYQHIEKAVEQGRRLTTEQRAVVLKESADDLRRLDRKLSSRLMKEHGPSPTRASLEQARPRLLGRPNGTLDGTILRDLLRSKTGDGLRKAWEVASLARQGGVDGDILAHDAAMGQVRLLSRIAAFVEANVGPGDSEVLYLRERIAAAELAGTADAKFAALEGAAELAGPLMGSGGMSLRMATEPACTPKVTIVKMPEGLCTYEGPPPHIDPDPMHIQILVQGLPEDEPGVLLVDIQAYDGQTLVFMFQARNVGNGIHDYFWDGVGDDGKLAQPRGNAKAGKFFVHAVLICPRDGPFDETKKEFQIARAGKGLIVQPGTAKLCPEGEQQFKAFKCKPGGGLQDVTNQVIWSVDNAKAGKIDGGGKFTAAKLKKPGESQDAIVKATDPATKEEGTASVSVVNAAGGISPASAVLCHGGVVDFDILKCKDGKAERGNDDEYTWSVHPKKLGTVTGEGVFTAGEKGQGKVRATKDGERYEADVVVSDIDGMDVLDAPVFMVVNSPRTQPFVVQVVCHNELVDGVAVKFNDEDVGGGRVSFNPVREDTVAGVADTDVKAGKRPSSAPFSTNLVATASGLSVKSPVTIGEMTILVHETANEDDDVVGVNGKVKVKIFTAPSGLAGTLTSAAPGKAAFAGNAATVPVKDGQTVDLFGIAPSETLNDVLLKGALLGEASGEEDLTVVAVDIQVRSTPTDDDDFVGVGENAIVDVLTNPPAPNGFIVFLTSLNPDKVKFRGGRLGDFTTAPMALNRGTARVSAIGLAVSGTQNDVTLEAKIHDSPCAREDMTVVDVVQAGDLWWFAGENATNYAERVTLSARGATDGRFVWDVTRGAALINLENNLDSLTALDDATADILSTGASAAAATVTKDITVRLSINGVQVFNFETAVFSPHRLVHNGNVDNVDATFFYSTLIEYHIQDQFNRNVPNGIELHERWTGAVVNDFRGGSNWRRGAEGNLTTLAGDAHRFVDNIGGENVAFAAVPTPMNPQMPLTATQVQHWPGEWRMGSLTIGRGKRVQTNVWQKYIDHARHETVVTPAP